VNRTLACLDQFDHYSISRNDCCTGNLVHLALEFTQANISIHTASVPLSPAEELTNSSRLREESESTMPLKGALPPMQWERHAPRSPFLGPSHDCDTFIWTWGGRWGNTKLSSGVFVCKQRARAIYLMVW
jgi:hypothetical protein